MTPRSRGALVERDTLELDIDSAEQMQNQLAQVDAARGRAAIPGPVITVQEEAGRTPNIA